MNDNRNKIHIEYSCFDIDDNLLHMPTKINMVNIKTGEEEGVSSEMFAEIRNDKDNWKLADDAFIEFRDFGPRGDNAFLEDLKYAVNNKEFAPSWDKFITVLENGYLFALITARGHSPNAIRKGIEWIVDNYLTDDQKRKMYSNLAKFSYHFKEIGTTDKHHTANLETSNFSQNSQVKSYLDKCDYYGVSNEEFVAKHKSGGADSPEVGKEIALKEFMDKVQGFANRIGATISFGMSDDDIRNVIHVEKVFKELKELYPDTIFRLYDTSKRGYTKKVIESRIKKYVDFIKESQSPGLESSILPFTSFNVAQGTAAGHFSTGGDEDRQDDYGSVFKQRVKSLTKDSNKVECKCGHSWDLDEGGMDPYTCHKCGKNNKKFN
jgi:hypothetical protein